MRTTYLHAILGFILGGVLSSIWWYIRTKQFLHRSTNTPTVKKKCSYSWDHAYRVIGVEPGFSHTTLLKRCVKCNDIDSTMVLGQWSPEQIMSGDPEVEALKEMFKS